MTEDGATSKLPLILSDIKLYRTGDRCLYWGVFAFSVEIVRFLSTFVNKLEIIDFCTIKHNLMTFFMFANSRFREEAIFNNVRELIFELFLKFYRQNLASVYFTIDKNDNEKDSVEFWKNVYYENVLIISDIDLNTNFFKQSIRIRPLRP